MEKLFNEWELMTDKEKKDMKRRAVYTAVQLGGLWGGFGSFIILGLTFPAFLNRSSTTIISTCAFFFILGATIHYFFVKRGLEEEIDKSNKRMMNQQYRSTLQQLGLLERK